MQQFNHPCCTSFGHLGDALRLEVYAPLKKSKVSLNPKATGTRSIRVNKITKAMQ